MRAPGSSPRAARRRTPPGRGGAGRPRSAGRRPARAALRRPPPCPRRGARTAGGSPSGPPAGTRGELTRAGKKGEVGQADLEVSRLSRATFAVWPMRPKPVMSVAARTPWRRATAAGMRLSAIERWAASATLPGAFPAFTAVAITPVPSGLVSTSDVARPAAGVRHHVVRVDQARDRVAELDLGIAHGVAAQQRAARFAQLGRPPRKMAAAHPAGSPSPGRPRWRGR